MSEAAPRERAERDDAVLASLEELEAVDRRRAGTSWIRDQKVATWGIGATGVYLIAVEIPRRYPELAWTGTGLAVRLLGLAFVVIVAGGALRSLSRAAGAEPQRSDATEE